MPAIIAAALMLFYLCAVPVHIAFRIRLGADNRFALSVSLFEPRFALRKVRQETSRFKPPKLSGSAKPSDILGIIRAAVRHARPDNLSVHGIFGSNDAASTALVCGCAAALDCALQGSIKKIHIDLQPDFSADRLRAELTGMISIRAGHIMIAALSGAFQYGSRRLKEWTSIPSKAS